MGSFWRLLVEERDAVGEIPASRFDFDQVFFPEPGRPQRLASRAGGFLEEIDLFDSGFFRISPREAARMDPQHRLMLEVTWEALEDAGIPAESIAGSNTGVYTGCLSTDY